MTASKDDTPAAVPGRRRRSVGRMLAVAFAGVITLMAILGVIRVAITEPLYREAEARRDQLVAAQAANHRVRTLFDRAQLALDGYLVTGDRAFLVPYEAAKQEAPAAMVDLLRKAGQGDADAVEVKERTDEWWSEAAAIIAADAGVSPGPAANVDAVAKNQGIYRRAVVASDALDEALIAEQAATFKDVLHIRTLTFYAAVFITVVAVGLAVGIGVRTTRLIVRPLAHMVDVLQRFSGGDLTARVALPDAPTEIAAVGASVNELAEEVIQARGHYETERQIYREVRELGTSIRRITTVAPAMAAAAQGLGVALHADHVVIRLAMQDGRRVGPMVWSAPGAPGDPTELAGTPATWFAGDEGGPFVLDDVPDVAPPPHSERVALRAAGAGPVITVAVGEKADHLGHLTLTRRQGAEPWGPFDVRLVELSVDDLGRSLVNARLYEREHRLVQQLQEVNETKAGLMSTVSHELRTPLTSISGYLELLRDEEPGPLTPAQARMLEIVDRNTARLRNLIEDLLIVSRIEEGRYRAIMTQLDAASIVSGALHAMEPVAEKAGVALTGEVHGPLPVQGDADQLDRLMMNMLSNAVKFTPADGSVTVVAERHGIDIVITVRDTGIGIPTADQPRLFGRFYRASNATEKAIPGTGLGLSISYAIVDQHGGALTVDSQEGVGSTFTILLPAADPAEATDAH